MISFAQFFAGFAFFLVGLKMFSTNLNQLTSLRFRKWITQFTPNNFIAAVWGVLLSILTAGNTYLTPFVCAGFQTVNALSLRRSIHMINWSRVGSCFYIYLAGFDIQIFILFLIGVAGTSFALSKPKRFSALMASVFALGLVLFGIQEIKDSTKIMVAFDWFNTIVAFANTHASVAFLAGLIFKIIAQSFFGALVVVLGLLDTNIFGIQQALLFMYGVYLGEAVLKALYLPILKDAFKQAVCMLPIYYGIAFLLGIGDYIAESYFDLPLLGYWAMKLSSSSKEFLAHVNFALHLLTALLITAFARPVESFLKSLASEGPGEHIRPVDIPSDVLDDPVITMEMISKEEMRLVRYLPAYHENLRSGKALIDDSMQEYLHDNLSRNFATIRSIYADLLHRGSYHSTISALILSSIERQNLLVNLENNLFDFSQTITSLQKASVDDPDLRMRFLNFVEALDVILLSLLDLMDDPDPFRIEVIDALTREREDLLKEVRDHFSERLSMDQRVRLIRLINLFESSIWIMKRLAVLYAHRMQLASGLEEGS
ncbi:MAG: Na/Pi cotransporter family protein [Chlamydiia bacterium]|nr:Na/Pi cotransporter family protein [Chlamydiia bacterium]